MPELAYTSGPSEQSVGLTPVACKHRHDEDFKAFVAREVVSSGLSKSSSAYLQSRPKSGANRRNALKWEDHASMLCQSSSWSLGESFSSLSIAMDARRFGSPAENTEIYVGVLRRDNIAYGFWLPPQAGGCPH